MHRLFRPAAGLALAASLLVGVASHVTAQQIPSQNGNNRDGVANATAEDGGDITFNTSDGTATTGPINLDGTTAAAPPRIPSPGRPPAVDNRIPVIVDATGPDGIPVGTTTSTSTLPTINGQPVESGTYIPSEAIPVNNVSAPEASMNTSSGDTTWDDGSADAPVYDDGSDTTWSDGSADAPVYDDGSGTTWDDGSADAPVYDDGSADTPAPNYTCSDFIGWYDAQSTYEAQGGTGQDWVTVDAVDPDWDGVACEYLMEG